MNTLFRNILTASFHGSIVILAVMLLRLVLKKTPRKYICLLWLLAGLRLLMPFQIQSDLSLQPSADPVAQVQQQISRSQTPAAPEDFSPADLDVPAPVQTPEALPDIQAPVTTVISSTPSPAPETAPEPDTGFDFLSVLPWFWLGIACCFGIYSLYTYLTLKLKVREAVKIPGGWECDRIETAFILGFIRPNIYIPMGMTSEEQRYILAHERTHLDKGDHWFKMVGFLALALHWFNPLAWAMLSLAGRDIELSCDEAVLEQLGCKREDYAMALIRLEERRSISTGAAFGRNAVRERIEAIMKFKKTTLAGIIVSACFVAGTTTAFAAVNSENSTKEAVSAVEQETVYNTNRDGIDDVDVEWWTYDEYKTWLGQEKQNIAELVKRGASGWTRDRGEFIWTQEVADETIALYEQNLEDIRNGARISKSVNGSDDVMIFESPDRSNILVEDNGGQTSADDELYQYVVEDDGTVLYSDDSELAAHTTKDSSMSEEDFAEFYSKYEQYGLTYEDSKLYYRGEPVQFFDDVVAEYSTADTTEVMWYLNSDGNVVLTAERGETSDGIGELTGVRVVSEEELEQNRADFGF